VASWPCFYKCTVFEEGYVMQKWKPWRNAMTPRPKSRPPHPSQRQFHNDERSLHRKRGKRTSRLGRMFCFCTQFRWSLGRSRVRTFWTWDWAEPASPGFVVCIVCYKVVCKCLLQNVNLAGYMIKDRNIAHDFLLYSWARECGWLSDLDVRHQSKWVIICLNSDVVLWSFLHTREWIL
jgi:hypothetical protein